MRISTTQIVRPPAAVDIGTLADVLAELLPQAGAHAIDKLTPRARTRIADPLLLAGSAVVVGGGFALFAAARSDLAELVAAMAMLRFGVGGFSAAIGAMAITALTSLALARRRSSETNP
jgi:hypothetical protein